MIQILIALIVVIALATPYVGLTLQGAPLVGPHEERMLLVLVTACLFIEGVRRVRTKAAVPQKDETRALREKNSALAERIRDLEGELATVSGQVREGRERAENLSRALTEAQSRLAATPTRAPAQASSQSIAEALQLLSLLQQRGRLIDFVMQDIAPIPNEQVGAVARFVHQGCRSVFQELFEMTPVREEAEGATIALADHPSPEHLRIQGKTPEYPAQATVLHRGWQTTRVSLPVVTGERQPPYVLAPADVEIQ